MCKILLIMTTLIRPNFAMNWMYKTENEDLVGTEFVVRWVMLVEVPDSRRHTISLVVRDK